MIALGLTGGIGCGKSAVADLLVARGAVLVDADQVARAVVEPGQPAYRALLEHFGPGILAPDGTLDRAALAARAFGSPEELAALNACTHPAIGQEMARQLAPLAGTDAVVVVAIPLLTPAHRTTLGLDAVVVVDCPPEVALERLVAQRGMDPADARARIAAQISREARLEDADLVVDNSADREALAAQVERIWEWVAARRATPDGAAGTLSGPPPSPPCASSRG